MSLSASLFQCLFYQPNNGVNLVFMKMVIIDIQTIYSSDIYLYVHKELKIKLLNKKNEYNALMK